MTTDDSLANAFARDAILRSPAETWQWLRGHASEGWQLTVEGTTCELVRGGQRASIDSARLRELVAAAYASELGHETFWLFVQDPLACLPSPGDRAMADDLELRWRAFDDDVRNKRLDDSVESVRRAALLAEARMAALFDEPLFDARVACLEEWRLPSLMSIVAAGRTLAAYLVSAERSRYVRDAKPATVRDASVSLDLVRSAQPPANVPLFAWLSVCEAALANMELEGTRGTVYVGQRNGTLVVQWRNEDGTRNVAYDASLRR